MIEAYFDESGRSDGTFCVAGYCYFPAQARKLEKKWGAILEGRTFHATDMNCRQGEFAGLSPEKSDKMYRELIAALLKHAELGIAASVNPGEIEVKWPNLDGFRTAYAVCCHQIIGRISSHLDERGIRSRVAYIFEDGYKDKPEADRYIDTIKPLERRREQYHYLSHSFKPKSKKPLLQTADLLAWEWAKFVSQRGFNGVSLDLSNMRGSLRELFSKGAEKHIAGHFSGHNLEEYFRIIRPLLPGGLEA